jgi:hypothetical protein
MKPYLVYYWVNQTDRHHPICEYLYAETIEDAEKKVEERLDMRIFSLESESHGRIIVVSAHVQYVEIERIHQPEADTTGMFEQESFFNPHGD